MTDKATTTAPLIEKQPVYKWRSGKEINSLKDAATWWLAQCQAQRKASNTIRTYRAALNTITQHIATNTGINQDELTPHDLTLNNLTDAMADYATTHAIASHAQTWSVWNSFCTALADHTLIPTNPMGRVVKPDARNRQRIPKTLPPEAVHTLLTTLQTPAANPTDDTKNRRWRARDYAMILLLLVTGLREHELCNLNVGDLADDYADDGARAIIVRGKGDKERLLVIEPAVVAVLADYLTERPALTGETLKRGKTIWHRYQPDTPLFVLRDGHRMTPGTLYSRVKIAYQDAGITAHRAQGALVHQLRHTMATMLADDPTVTVHQLKRILGHSSLSATERYTLGAGRATRTASANNPVYRMI